MKSEHLSTAFGMMLPQADPSEVQTQKRRTQKIGFSRPHSDNHGLDDDDGKHLTATNTHRLLLIQEFRVVCVVERHRHDSALSVARLLCRLRLSDVFVYSCPAAEADSMRPDQQVEHLPGTWQEVYRATPCAEPMINEANSHSVIGIG